MAYSVKIKNILRQFNKKIPFLQPVYESIVNSLEANATNIIVEFTEEKLLALVDEQNVPIDKKITGFKITDNGDGFDKKNLDSFKDYLSDTKLSLGCKGVGRFTWLKVFEDIKVESHVNGMLVKFDFNENTSLDDIEETTIPALGTNKTIIYFNDVSMNYLERLKSGKVKVDKREIADIEQIAQKVEDYLLPKLFLLKEEQHRTFSIKLKLNDKEIEITNDSIVALNKDSFTINDDRTMFHKEYGFNLYYTFLNRNDNKHQLMYCANERTVTAFKNISLGDLPDGKNAIMLLTSEYLDKRINDERNEFTFDFSENNPDDDNPITGKQINDKLKTLINKIMETTYPEIKEINKQTKEQCIEEYPYLKKYIEPLEISIIESKKNLIDKATQLYEQEKKQAKDNLARILKKKKRTVDDEVLKGIEKVNDISARELAKYIMYREQVLTALRQVIDDNETNESLLHNLFMKMGSSSEKEGNKNILYDSNLWLLDDKFLSYFSAFSDTKIKEMKDRILKEYESDADDLKEPDLTAFYSNVEGDTIDLIVIEFKAIGANALQKSTALLEVERNIGAIASSFDNIRNIYGYVITNIDDELARIFKRSGLSKLYSTGQSPIFYKYNNGIEDANNKGVDTHIYLLTADAICRDAKSRNDVFLNIIKK